MRSLPSLAIALALSCAVPCASAQVFKWVDDDGVVNYGDWPPWGARLQEITHGTVSAVAGVSKPRTAETRATDGQRSGPRPKRNADSTQAADDAQYSGVYAADYGYRARAVRRVEPFPERALPERPVAEPRPAANLPAVPDMPRPVRR